MEYSYFWLSLYLAIFADYFIFAIFFQEENARLNDFVKPMHNVHISVHKIYNRVPEYWMIDFQDQKIRKVQHDEHSRISNNNSEICNNNKSRKKKIKLEKQ